MQPCYRWQTVEPTATRKGTQKQPKSERSTTASTWRLHSQFFFFCHASTCQWITDMQRQLACYWKYQTWDPAISLKTCLLINIGGLLKVLGTLKNRCEESCAAHIMYHTFCTNPMHWVHRTVKSQSKSWNFRQFLKLNGAYCFHHDKRFLMNPGHILLKTFKSHI